MRENHRNEFIDFNEFTLYMNFKIFHGNSHFRKSNFQKNSEKHTKGEFVKIREFTQVIIFVIIPQNSILGLKMKVLKFLGIQPTIGYI